MKNYCNQTIYTQIIIKDGDMFFSETVKVASFFKPVCVLTMIILLSTCSVYLG